MCNRVIVLLINCFLFYFFGNVFRILPLGTVYDKEITRHYPNMKFTYLIHDHSSVWSGKMFSRFAKSEGSMCWESGVSKKWSHILFEYMGVEQRESWATLTISLRNIFSVFPSHTLLLGTPRAITNTRAWHICGAIIAAGSLCLCKILSTLWPHLMVSHPIHRHPLLHVKMY